MNEWMNEWMNIYLREPTDKIRPSTLRLPVLQNFIFCLQGANLFTVCLLGVSPRTANVFPVVASLPPKNKREATTGNTSLRFAG